MATYEEWNQALLNYTIAGLAGGTRVYIAADDDILAHVANTLQATVNEFITLLRRRCILSNRVAINRIRPHRPGNYERPPPYFAFLCAMVLAANQMGDQEDDGIDSKAYFHYLNAILGLSNVTGRPPGMEGGVEVALWKDWAIWLQYHGYQPTAASDGHLHYKYALSEALVRPVDRTRLWRHFSDEPHRFPDDLCGDDLIRILRAEVRRDQFLLTRHLSRLLESDGAVGALRYDDLTEAIEEGFASWVESGKPSSFTKATRAVRDNTLCAGLYRSEDPINRAVVYYLLPKQPRHEQRGDLSIIYAGEEVSLQEERPGWYEALPWPLTSDELTTGVNGQVKGHVRIKTLVLPARDFWILPLDPNDAMSGVYGTWQERPELGVPFVLLVKSVLWADLNLLQQEGLLQWQSKQPRIVGGNWLEFTIIIVSSDRWAGFELVYPELMSRLRPIASIGISLQGGLRDIKSGAWVVGHVPQLIVHASSDAIDIALFALGNEQPLWRLSKVKAAVPINLEIPEPGDYLLGVTVESQERTRSMHVIDWSALPLTIPECPPPIDLQKMQMFGAWLTEK